MSRSLWCKLRAGEDLYGVVAPQGKEPYDDILTNKKVVWFFAAHLTARLKRAGTGAGMVPLDPASLKTALDALCDRQKDQYDRNPELCNGCDFLRRCANLHVLSHISLQFAGLFEPA